MTLFSAGSGSRSRSGSAWHGTMLTVLAVILVGLLVLGGGSARADVPQLVLLRPVATLTLLVALFSHARVEGSGLRGLWALVLASAGLIAVMLIPLPPIVWQALPGRQVAVDATVAAGLTPTWRPLTLIPDRTLNALVAMMPPIALLALVTLLDRRRLGAILYLVAALIAVGALLGALQTVAMSGSALRLYAVTNQDASVGLFANRNHHAVFLACGIPIIAWLVKRIAPRFNTAAVPLAIAGATILFLVALILANGSRSGLVALAFGSILTGAMLARDGTANLRTIMLSGAILLVGLAIILTFGENLRTLDRLGIGSNDEMRYSSLGEYWRMFVGYFPVGSGFGTFPDVYRIVEPDAVLRPTYLNAAHNDLAQLAIEGGIAALALLSAFLAWCGLMTWRIWSGGADKAAVRGIGMGRVASIVTAILLLASLFDYPLRTPMLASLLLVACALMAIAADNVADPARAAAKRRR